MRFLSHVYLVSFQPENLIPGLDLSCVNSAEENDFSPKPEEASSSVEIKTDRLIKSVEPMSQFRYCIIHCTGRSPCFTKS